MKFFLAIICGTSLASAAGISGGGGTIISGGGPSYFVKDGTSNYLTLAVGPAVTTFGTNFITSTLTDTSGNITTNEFYPGEVYLNNRILQVRNNAVFTKAFNLPDYFVNAEANWSLYSQSGVLSLAALTGDNYNFVFDPTGFFQCNTLNCADGNLKISSYDPVIADNNPTIDVTGAPDSALIIMGSVHATDVMESLQYLSAPKCIIATNTASFNTDSNPTNSFYAGLSYTNDGTRVLLVGSAVLKPANNATASINLYYTNSGVAYTLPMMLNTTLNNFGTNIVPFSVPLSPGATFRFSTNGNTSTSISYVTNVVLWKM